MKRAFAWLYPLGFIAVLLSFPWPPPLTALLVAEIVVALLVWTGLHLGAPHGLGSAIPSPKRALVSLLIGFGTGALALAMLPLAGLQSRIIREASIPLWKWLVISFSAAVLEEIFFRLFLLSFVVWLLARFISKRNAIAAALIVSALAFGAVHLTRWIHQGPFVIGMVLLVNGIVAVVIGWIYVKWGIESAMLAHFAGDVMVHIIGPHFFL